ncbi:MAG: hypothetical protein CFE23_03165 [Flavobacterium sp. BFFFF1]|uniref:hypothetical protein n=1 Tax=Flavobacterium sp. BFFFF1 TaxID=2015557 RepID=UPI000BDB16B6|nr:hypothetical protein [Flavobacterium sp. BFFFF1]OYU81888.1 MAG: hypothetical protein CFE23_03165 [Flavobacterium sp. BFFFF1]
MKIKKLALLFALPLLFSCAKEPLSNDAIDALIKKYDTEDFSSLKNVYVGYRGKDETANVMLMVAEFDISCPPYIATVYPETKELIKTDDHLIKDAEKECKLYFKKEQIARYSKAFLKYNFKVLGVDSDGNAYINPTEQELPNLLRKVPSAHPKDIDDFKHYRGNWYVRKAQ